MLFDVMNLFPPNIRIASCENCGRLIGFTEDEILHFETEKTDVCLYGLICPQCDTFLLLPNFKDDFGQNYEINLS